MTEQHEREDAVRTLGRMLAYTRLEAVRLNLLDVAVLLEHAEGVITTFAPCVLPDHGRRMPTHDERNVEH